MGRLHPSRSVEMSDRPETSIHDWNALSESSQMNMSSLFAPMSKLEQSKRMSKPMEDDDD